MKKVFVLFLCLLFIPVSYAANQDNQKLNKALKDFKDKTLPYDGNCFFQKEYSYYSQIQDCWYLCREYTCLTTQQYHTITRICGDGNKSWTFDGTCYPK